jgi:hypothetical protein
MSQPKWKFLKPQDSIVNQDPIEGEFFTTQDVGDFADALVRESIQNSLDAKLDKENTEQVVTVRFYFSGKTNANDVRLNNHPYFKGIYPHIVSADNGLNKKEIPALSEKTQYIVIEDFQTVGLDGSITENDDPRTDSPLGHNFYWFWRNIGRSGKKGSERGKWGLGKTVFPASSTINTFFALTNRWDDNENYLMGLSVLKTHHLAAEPTVKRYPYGYFGVFENADEYFATPTNDKKLIEDFRRTFNLKRDEHTSSGLSVVIPFPRKEITSESIIKSVLKQYFYPIISGNLTVEVVDDDNSIDTPINENTIFELLEAMKLTADYSKLFKLCLWSLQLPEQDYITLKRPPIENASRWLMDWFLNDDIKNLLKTKMDLFENGKPVAFKVPVRIKEYEAAPQISFFKVFMEKDELLREADAYFVRDGITITGQGKRVGNKFVRAIVVIEEKVLVKLLGLAENPAHTEWQRNSSHFRGKYEDGDKVIAFIERTIDNLYTWLIKPAEGIDREMMRDVFYIELPDGGDEPDEPDDEPGDELEKPKPPRTEGKTLPFVLEQEVGGFRLKKNPAVDGFVGSIRVETAYMVVKGSPLKRYSKYDFDLGRNPITVTSSGVINLEYKENRLSFNVKPDSEFSVEVSGFDEERDLFIKAYHYDSEI